MNEYVAEYYERLLIWIEATRLACRADNFNKKLLHKEEELQADEDPFADDFGDAAYRISEGMFSTCELLLRNAVTYGHQRLGLEPYQGSSTAMALLIEDLLGKNAHLDYYAGVIHAALRRSESEEIISLEEIERRYRHKEWRKCRIRNGLGVGGGLFDEEWCHGTEGRPPLRDTVPWLEAWDNYQAAKATEGYITIEE